MRSFPALMAIPFVGCCVAPALRITNHTPEKLTITVQEHGERSRVVSSNRSVVFPLFYQGRIRVVTAAGIIREYPSVRFFDYNGQRSTTWLSGDFPCWRGYTDAELKPDWTLFYPPIAHHPKIVH